MSNWGALPAFRHDRTRPLWRWKCHGLGRDHHDWSTELHICPGTVAGLCYRHNAIQPIVVLYARRHGNAFIFLRREPMVHVLFKITCSFAQLRLSHGQRSPQSCLQLNIGRTSTEDASGDVLTSHRTSTSSLMHSRRNGAGSPKQPLGGSSGA